MANPTFPAFLTKKGNKIQIEISKDKLESFMNSCGIFRKDFLKILEQSEKDHKTSKITRRKSLRELMGKE